MVLAILILLRKPPGFDPFIETVRFHEWGRLRSTLRELTEDIEIKRMINKATIEELELVVELLDTEYVNYCLEILSDY